MLHSACNTFLSLCNKKKGSKVRTTGNTFNPFHWLWSCVYIYICRQVFTLTNRGCGHFCLSKSHLYKGISSPFCLFNLWAICVRQVAPGYHYPLLADKETEAEPAQDLLSESSGRSPGDQGQPLAPLWLRSVGLPFLAPHSFSPHGMTVLGPSIIILLVNL